VSETQEQAQPVKAFERGRYALFGDSLMSLVIGRSTDLCESCLSCGCGTAQEPIKIADMIKEAMAGGPRKLGRALKEMMPGG
jgi:hypothetical protein